MLIIPLLFSTKYDIISISIMGGDDFGYVYDRQGRG